MILLCYIIDEYKDFVEKIYNFLKTKNGDINYTLLYKLNRVSNKKKCFNGKTVYLFYEENKEVIDKINEYYSIDSFIRTHFGVYKIIDEIEMVYQYLVNNRDNIDDIIKLLNKIKSLGIKVVLFDEDFNFGDNKYSLINGDNLVISYVDNLEIIPNYDDSVIKYKTTGSNYQIDLATRRFSNKIYLNSLIFNIDRLPDTIAKDDVIHKIISLKKKQKEEINVVKKSVNLNISVDDLSLSVLECERVIDYLDDVTNKHELVEAIDNIKQEIVRIESIRRAYDINATINNEHITEDVLEEEKKLVLDRRDLLSLDVDYVEDI